MRSFQSITLVILFSIVAPTASLAGEPGDAGALFLHVDRRHLRKSAPHSSFFGAIPPPDAGGTGPYRRPGSTGPCWRSPKRRVRGEWLGSRP